MLNLYLPVEDVTEKPCQSARVDPQTVKHRILSLDREDVLVIRCNSC